jgi:hypothetical protein
VYILYELPVSEANRTANSVSDLGIPGARR